MSENKVISVLDSILLDFFYLSSLIFTYSISFSLFILNLFLSLSNINLFFFLPFSFVFSLLLFQLLVALEVNFFKLFIEKEGTFFLKTKKANLIVLTMRSYSIYRDSLIKGLMDKFHITRFLFYYYVGSNIAFNHIQGKNVTINEPWNVTIRPQTVLGDFSFINPHLVSGNKLITNKIIIEGGATIGHHTTISPGAIIGKNSIIMSHSLVKHNTVVGDNEVWGGIPAKFIKKNE